MPKKKIIILKIGGGLITDKNIEFSIRESILDAIILDIIKSGKQLILVHGGGSFGHPLAKKFSIQSGYNDEIQDQLIGLIKTNSAMLKLNNIIVDKFINLNFQVFPFHPSSMFFLKNTNNLLFSGINSIRKALSLGITPILYGDTIFTNEKGFEILSGDRIILELCKCFNDSIDKVIFSMEQDGLIGWITNKKDGLPKILENIDCDQLDSVCLDDLGNKIDVTGGIHGKLNNIKSIAKMGININLINGLKPNLLYYSLTGTDIQGTKIIGKKR